MTDRAVLNRRRFLAAGAVVAGGMLAGHAGLGWRPLGVVRPHRAVTGLFAHPDSARAIGAGYLQRHPHEAHRDLLEARIATDVGGLHGRGASRRVLAARLQARVRQDFAEDRIVNVHGWILSATEARLCALVALG